MQGNQITQRNCIYRGNHTTRGTHSIKAESATWTTVPITQTNQYYITLCIFKLRYTKDDAVLWNVFPNCICGAANGRLLLQIGMLFPRIRWLLPKKQKASSTEAEGSEFAATKFLCSYMFIQLRQTHRGDSVKVCQTKNCFLEGEWLN